MANNPNELTIGTRMKGEEGMKRFDNRTVIVTGGARRLGASFALGRPAQLRSRPRCPFGPHNPRRVARRAGAPCGDPHGPRPRRPFVGTHQDELPAKSER